MRNLKSRFGLVAMLLLTLGAFSCAREDVEVDNTPYTPKESAIYKHIADHKKERTRSGELTKLEPVVYEGDTVMYVANYGEGWEVFSNSTTLPMVLMRSESGHLDTSTLKDNPTFTAFFDMSKANLAAEMHDTSAEAQPGSEEWAAYGLQTVNGGPMRKPAPEPVVLVGKGSESVERDIPHLTKTRWSQNNPYNQYIPKYLDSDEHAPAGCGPIAVAQYFYYYHYKFNLPVNSVTSVEEPSGVLPDKYYKFYGSSSTIWDQMPLGTPTVPSLAQAKPAAMLIGDIANKLNVKYAEFEGESSSTPLKNIVNLVNETTNQNLSFKSFSATTAYNIINSGKPIIANFENVKGSYHALLIDATTKVDFTELYFYVPKSVAGDIDPVFVPTGVTYEQMVYQYGNVVSVSRVSGGTRYYFKMNWGWGIGANVGDPEINSVIFDVTNGGHTYKSAQIAY